MFVRPTVIAALLTTAAVLLSGCGGEDPEEPSGTTTGTTTTGDATSGTSTGQAAGELPDGFPEDVPLPEGAQVATATSMGEDQYLVLFEYTDDCDRFIEFLDGLGSEWSLSESTPMPSCADESESASLRATYDGPGRQVTYSYGSQGGTNLTVTVLPRAG